MKTKGKRVSLYVLGCLLIVSVSLFSSCNGGKSQSAPTLEGAKQAFEAYIEAIQGGNVQEAVRTHCRGKLKESQQTALAYMNMMGDKPQFLGNNTSIVKAELLPGYSDVAILLVDMGDGGEDMSYVLHYDESEEWKLYYGESSDLTLVKGFITDEVLMDWGIFTLTDSEVEDYLK